MLSVSLLLAFAHPATMAPQTAKQHFANLLIQVPPKEHFCLLEINLKFIEYRGKAWYAKLRIERETVDQLLALFVKGEEERGGCTFVCRSKQREKSVDGQEWRLNCCFGDHDKSARKAAANVAQPTWSRQLKAMLRRHLRSGTKNEHFYSQLY
jgi:hypothetical protein